MTAHAITAAPTIHGTGSHVDFAEQAAIGLIVRRGADAVWGLRAGDYALAPVHVASRSGSHNETAHRILKGVDAWLNRTKG